MSISVITSAKPYFRDLTTVIYIHAFLFLMSDSSDLAKVLVGVIFPGSSGGMAGGGCGSVGWDVIDVTGIVRYYAKM